MTHVTVIHHLVVSETTNFTDDNCRRAILLDTALRRKPSFLVCMVRLHKHDSQRWLALRRRTATSLHNVASR